MSLLNLTGIILGSAWASGVNLYLTAAGLGLAHRLGWLVLPGDLQILANPLVITAAIILYVIEFVADKIPYVDSAWDAVHTAIRPVGGALLAYWATSEAAPVIQAVTALAGGTLAFDSHMTKAGARAAINTSPEPVTNSVASLSEDALVVGSLWLMAKHPWVMLILVAVFISFSIWLLPKIFHFFGRIFRFLLGQRPGVVQHHEV
ncbi:MAG: DUF4126 domain-containing protein [Candidatus Omnitrophica bacterium]|nr:DUF4126 domain-containing protein [Candidatus Omnitrophota bacterium]